MNSFTFFCWMPEFRTSQNFDTFEAAFRAHHAYVDMVMDKTLDFDRIDNGMGIVDNNGTVLLAPEVNLRAIRSGLMDKVLMEKEMPIDEASMEVIASLAAKAECENLLANYPAEVAKDLILSGVV